MDFVQTYSKSIFGTLYYFHWLSLHHNEEGQLKWSGGWKEILLKWTKKWLHHGKRLEEGNLLDTYYVGDIRLGT